MLKTMVKVDDGDRNANPGSSKKLFTRLSLKLQLLLNSFRFEPKVREKIEISFVRRDQNIFV